MKTNLQLSQEELLLAARQQGLQKAAKQNLRALGKLWNMDVFAWGKPNIEELHTTIGNFPFPVFWVATPQQLEIFFQLDECSTKNLEWIAQYNGTKAVVSPEMLRHITLFTATDSIEDALVFLENCHQDRRILLFSFDGNEWMNHLQTVEDFVAARK